MSMPLLESIEQQNKIGQITTWILRTSKGKIVYVIYHKNKLCCRYDNRYTGKEFFIKTWANKAPSTLSTEEMLKYTRFKLQHPFAPSYIESKSDDEPNMASVAKPDAVVPSKFISGIGW